MYNLISIQMKEHEPKNIKNTKNSLHTSVAPIWLQTFVYFETIDLFHANKSISFSRCRIEVVESFSTWKCKPNTKLPFPSAAKLQKQTTCSLTPRNKIKGNKEAGKQKSRKSWPIMEFYLL